MIGTTRLTAPLFTSETGKSLRFGINQLSRQPRQNSFVAVATGFLLRVVSLLNQISACSRKVTSGCSGLASLLKYFSVSAPLLAIISLARRWRSDLVIDPGPEIGQILARSRLRFS